MDSFNPKQAREQKVRRDRRRKDNRRPEQSRVEPESTPTEQREPSSHIEPPKTASEAVTEPPDFSKLKRETDEIAALKSKKYCKRQIFSNWTKYENPAGQSEEEDDGRRADFETLALLSASAGSHFKFKSERSWDVSQSSLYTQYFAVDVDYLAQGLACIPLYDKIQLPRDMLTNEELERIEYFAKQSSARYNVSKSSLKEGNNHVNKILDILSYQTTRKTDPSMYENVDEDDQLENKSLVQFCFDESCSVATEQDDVVKSPCDTKSVLEQTAATVNCKGKYEENNNVVGRTDINNSCSELVEEVNNGNVTDPCVGESVVELAVTLESDVEEPVKQLVEGRNNKVPGENSRKTRQVDDELDFLLSLKKPVIDVKPKTAPTPSATSAIDEDDADKLATVVQKISEENLEDWLDSMLDD